MQYGITSYFHNTVGPNSLLFEIDEVDQPIHPHHCTKWLVQKTLWEANERVFKTVGQHCASSMTLSQLVMITTVDENFHWTDQSVHYIETIVTHVHTV